jgi:hypothetical protein
MDFKLEVVAFQLVGFSSMYNKDLYAWMGWQL